VRLLGWTSRGRRTVFGDVVRDARLAHKIRPGRLAKRLDTSASRLRDIEANRNVPSADVVREIGRLLGLKMDDVLSPRGFSTTRNGICRATLT
jgi:ribosome-binding protein aMBF1 (putative translation factor)